MSAETREVQAIDRDGKEDALLTTGEVAKLFALSPLTLAHWRKKAHLAGPPFIKVERAVRYPLRGLEKWLAARTVRPDRSAAFYRRTRIEELGVKHAGLLEFVEEQVRLRTPYPKIAAAILSRWNERVSCSVLSNFYVSRIFPKEFREERSKTRSH